jgi:hypothetical protein
MYPYPFPIPGALRLRTLQPLIDGDGSCSLVYDAERAAVFEVPADLRLYAAPALETGNLDEELLGWLASEDLLTAERWGDWSDGCQGVADLGEEVHGWIDQNTEAQALEGLTLVFRRALGGSRLKLHLDWVGTLPAGTLLEKVVGEATRRARLSRQDVSFELALDPHQVSAEVARRLAALPVHVRLRCGECDPLDVLGTPQENRPWLVAEPAVRLLLNAHDPRPSDPSTRPASSPLPPLTVQCVLDGPARLAELWRWAQTTGVRSLDAIRLEEPGEQGAPGAAGTTDLDSTVSMERARLYSQDLSLIFEETCVELEAGRQPVEFQPLTRIVRRLMRSEPPASMAASRDEMAMEGGGGSFVAAGLAGMETLDPRLLPELMWVRLERPTGLFDLTSDGLGGRDGGSLRGEAGDSDAAGARGDRHPAGTPAERGRAATLAGRQEKTGTAGMIGVAGVAQRTEESDAEGGTFACQTCWARQVCSHSAYVASPLNSEDPREPSRERCAFWSAEVEMALRFYHRLAQIDALQVLRFFEGDVRMAPPTVLPSFAASPYDFNLADLLMTSKPS